MCRGDQVRSYLGLRASTESRLESQYAREWCEKLLRLLFLTTNAGV